MSKKIDNNEEDICFVTCESCQSDVNYKDTNQDDDCNYFCQPCWDELAPVMKAEYEELKAKGEID